MQKDVVYRSLKVGLSSADREKMRKDIEKRLRYGGVKAATLEEIKKKTKEEGVFVSTTGSEFEKDYWWYFAPDSVNQDGEEIGHYEVGGYYGSTEKIDQILRALTYNHTGLLWVSAINPETGNITLVYNSSIVRNITDVNTTTGNITITARPINYECKPKGGQTNE